MKNMHNKRFAIPRGLAYLLIIASCVMFWYVFFYDPPYAGLITIPTAPLVFSHRGFGNHGPDNSLVAAELAMKNNLDGVDVDGQYSKDQQLVIFHDLSLDRLTTTTGRVSSKTLKELRSVDLATKYGNGFRNAYVASFEDFVKALTPSGIVMVELKVPGTNPTGIEEQAVQIIEKYHAFDKVYLSSFNPIVLYRLKKINPKVRTVFIFMDTNWNADLLAEIKKEDLVNLPWYLRNEPIRRAIRKIIKPDALSVNNEVNESVIDGLIQKGYPVFLWTVNTRDRIKWALQKQPYGIISDEPLEAKSIRDETN